FLLVCRLRSEVHYPWVMVVYRQDQPLALLAGRVETIPFAPSIGYLKCPGIPVKTLTVLYHGFLGLQDGPIAGLLVRDTLHWLSDSDVGQVIFPALDIRSSLHTTLMKQTPAWYCEKGILSQLHWQACLSDAADSLLKRMKSKHRAYLLKRQSTFLKAFNGRIKWQWLTEFEHIADTLLKIEQLACKTYQRGLGTGFNNDMDYRERMDLYARRGVLRMALLWVDDTLVCFCIGIVYGDILYGSELGYDQAFKDYSPGILLILWMMEQLRHEGVYNVDWGLGDAQYKRQLGTTAWLEQSILLFKSSWYFLLLRFFLGASLCLDRTARNILDRTDLTARIKSAWRRHLTRPGDA
ncbi:MAG: GNAT family N-acetyltransferase, partial [Methylococcaceae bacterium]